MTFGVVEASWTFVQSPTYTAISIVVGLIAGTFLTALVIQQELLQTTGAKDDPARHSHDKPPISPRILMDDRPPRPRGRVAATPLILCFVVIVILRLATLAYQRPNTTPPATTIPTAHPTAAPTR